MKRGYSDQSVMVTVFLGDDTNFSTTIVESGLGAIRLNAYPSECSLHVGLQSAISLRASCDELISKLQTKESVPCTQ